MKKKIIVIAILSVCVIVAGTAAYSMSGNASVGEYFQKIKNKLVAVESVADNIIVEDADYGVKVTVEDFVHYKANKTFLYGIQHLSDFPDNLTLLEEIMANQLFINHARTLGLVVTDDELSTHIGDLRQALLGDVPAEMKEIMDNTIQNTGLSEDEYWEDASTRNTYEGHLLSLKLITELSLFDHDALAAFKNNLYRNIDFTIDFEELALH